MTHVAVVGASLAGLRAVEALRRAEFEGRITFVGDEPHAPYDRPPLSKQVLAGEWEPGRTTLAAPEKLAELQVETRFGVRATGLNLESKAVTLDSGESLSYDGLVIATGARCRELSHDGLSGIHTLRTIDDAEAIASAFDAGPRVAVVGAGFIGAEVAATAKGRGLDVTLIESLPVPLGRVLGDELGNLCGDIHREHGVDLRLGVGVDGFVGADGAVSGVKLADGSVVAADLVVVGIGVVPNTEWLEGSGLTLDNGVLCDETCLAAPNVVAAGDVARWPNPRFGEVMRVEHWENAAEQGGYSARRLLTSLETSSGRDPVEPFAPVPWFWSDQYDRKMQLAGRVRFDDHALLVTGSTEERRFATIFERDGKLVGVFGMNRPRHVMQYRQMIATGASFEEAVTFSKS